MSMRQWIGLAIVALLVGAGLIALGGAWPHIALHGHHATGYAPGYYLGAWLAWTLAAEATGLLFVLPVYGCYRLVRRLTRQPKKVSHAP